MMINKTIRHVSPLWIATKWWTAERD